ncbi:MAG: hypothetical protein ACKOW5_09865, partial [Actinomycetales bacterium]
MILKTRQGRYRVKVKDHGAIVADRTFAHWNDAEAWEADRQRQVAAGRLAPASAGRRPLIDIYAEWSRCVPDRSSPVRGSPTSPPGAATSLHGSAVHR